MGRNLTFDITLAPNDVISTRWQHPYTIYFGPIYMQEEEAEKPLYFYQWSYT